MIISLKGVLCAFLFSPPPSRRNARFPSKGAPPFFFSLGRPVDLSVLFGVLFLAIFPANLPWTLNCPPHVFPSRLIPLFRTRPFKIECFSFRMQIAR